MTAHVDQTRHSMFQQSVDEVRQQLKRLTKDVEARMNDKTDEVFVSMQRDYRSVLGGGAPEGQLLPKSERLLRKEVLRIVDGVEAVFRRIAAGEIPEDDDDEDETAENDGSRQPDPKPEQPLESGVQVKHELDEESKSTNPDTKSSSMIKAETQEDETMRDVPESRDETSDGHVLQPITEGGVKVEGETADTAGV